MRALLTISFLFFAVYATAQQPAMLSLKGYGGDQFDAVGISSAWKTFDGGFIMGIGSLSDIGTGNIDTFCSSNGNKSIFLKCNSVGELEWSQYILADGDTALQYMFPRANGATIYGGEFLSNYGWGFYIAKHDVIDNIIWSRSYSVGNSPLLRTMIQTSDGGYIMAGISYYTDSNVAIHYGSWAVDDIWVLKLDSSGNKSWSTVIGGTGYDGVRQVVETDNGEFFVIGNTTSTDYDCIGHHGGYNDGFISRLDANGNVIWRRCLGGSGTDGISAACSNGAGGVILAGITTSTDGDVHNSTPDTRWWALEIDNNNNILWDNCYEGNEVNSVCKSIDGTIWIGGYSQTQGVQVYATFGNNDAYLAHLGGNGNFISSVVLGSSYVDQFRTLYPLSNNLILTGGYYYNNNGAFNNLPSWGNGDAFLALFAPWTTSIPEIASHHEQLSVYPNPATNVTTVNLSQPTAQTLTVTDVLGREVFQTAIADQTQFSIPVSNWIRGIYYVRVKNADGRSEVAKLILQ